MLTKEDFTSFETMRAAKEAFNETLPTSGNPIKACLEAAYDKATEIADRRSGIESE